MLSVFSSAAVISLLIETPLHPVSQRKTHNKSSQVRFKAYLPLQVHDCDHSSVGEVGLPN